MNHLHSRRDFLAGLVGLGARALFQSRPGRIDVHHHFGSPAWISMTSTKKTQGYQTWQPYTPARAIEDMDRGGVSMSMITITTPGIWFGNLEETRRMARQENEYGARMVSDHKGRFGLFAVLPLPDVDASLKEIDYAFDMLKADGVGLLTSYGDIWLGDKRLQPVFDELNRRNAIVYTHPTDATCCHNIAGQNPGTLEWFTDTARTILSLVAEGPALGGRGEGRTPSPATRYSNIRFIWSHGGGNLIASTRIIGAVSEKDLSGTPSVNSHLYHVRRFYYDTAGALNPIVMQGLKKLLGGTSHIV